MNWQTLLKKLKATGTGYKGADNDLNAVKKFLDDELIDLELDGKAVDVDALHAKAYPSKKKLDVTGDAQAARIAELEEQLAVKETETQMLTTKSRGKDDTETKGKDHSTDYKVGKDRYEDDPKAGFPSFGHFIQAVKAAGGDPGGYHRPHDESPLGKWNKSYSARCMAEAETSFKSGFITKATLSTYSNELAGAEGGFAVPPEFRTGIMNRIEGSDTLVSLCDRANLTGNSLTAAIDETTPWQTSGGILVYWEQEAGAITQSKLQLKERTWRLRKLTALCPLSDELAQDAGFLTSYITRKAGDKLSFAADKSILSGTGVGQPQGIVGHGGTVSITKETNQTAATIKANNVQKMWMACEIGARRDAVWVINPDAQVQLQRMFVQGTKDSNTFVAAGSLVYLPANGLAGNPNDMLMGKRIIYHQAASTLGTVGDINLCSFPQYLVCMKAQGMESASSIHLWFDQSVTALRFVLRMDGQPWYPTTVSALNGSQTYASFVTLATRS